MLPQEKGPRLWEVVTSQGRGGFQYRECQPPAAYSEGGPVNCCQLGHYCVCREVGPGWKNKQGQDPFLEESDAF